MTIPKSLPPGSDHRAEVHKIADQMQGVTDALTKTQTAPRPEGGGESYRNVGNRHQVAADPHG
jgi:hypothetical protein